MGWARGRCEEVLTFGLASSASTGDLGADGETGELVADAGEVGWVAFAVCEAREDDGLLHIL
jgi:hypothetical protein